MNPKRPALSNLVVCSVFKLRHDHPEVFQALGQDSAQDGTVSSYDVLSCLTGRDFEDCFNAVHKAEDTGLIGLGSDTGDGWLTPQGHDFMDSIPLDILDLCRQAAKTLSASSGAELVKALDAIVPVQQGITTRLRSDSVVNDIEVDLPGVDFDDDIDSFDIDDEDDPPLARRPSSRV